MAVKYINIKLTDSDEREKRIMEWLEGKPAKFVCLEALEMYMNRYDTMKKETETGSVGPAKEDTKPAVSNAKVNKFMQGMGDS